MKRLVTVCGIVFLFVTQTALKSPTSSPNSKDLNAAPPAIHKDGKTFVPIDILDNRVKWEVSILNSIVNAEAIVSFQVGAKGFPFLLLNPNALAKDSSGTPLQTLPMHIHDVQGNYYFLNRLFEPGTIYQIKFSYSFVFDFEKNKNFLPLDYGKHSYIEHGIPANALFDHFPVTVTIDLKKSVGYELISNGKIDKSNNGQYSLSFPDYFTSISHFIDLVPKSSLVKNEAMVSSANGRTIPIVSYSTSDDPAHKLTLAFLENVKQTFHNLERKFGDYPYNQIVVKVSDKGAGTGSYAGAMSLSSFYIEHIAHELSHHWFLQSVSPLNGADTWLYEGLGFWVPYLDILGGFTHVENLRNGVSLPEGQYALWSNDRIFRTGEVQSPHQAGGMILAAINQFIKTNGRSETAKLGLSPILKLIFSEKKNQTMSTEEFKRLLELHTGLNFESLFDYYFDLN